MMNSLALNVLYYGQQAELPKRLPLRAGPVSLVFENGAIRYIRLGDREVLRNVYAAVPRLDGTSLLVAMTDPQTFRCRLVERVTASGELMLALNPYATARVLIQSEERSGRT